MSRDNLSSQPRVMLRKRRRPSNLVGWDSRQGLMAAKSALRGRREEMGWSCVVTSFSWAGLYFNKSVRR